MKVENAGWAERRHSLKVYIPSRCAIVLAPFEFAQKYDEITKPHFDPEDPAFKPYIDAYKQELKTQPKKKAPQVKK